MTPASRSKDYRIDGPGRYMTMTLHPHEFIRRFLMHVLPKGLHRIRHYGLLANGNRADNIARVRELIAHGASRQGKPEEAKAADTDQPCVHARLCPCCGGRMLIIKTFAPPRLRAQVSACSDHATDRDRQPHDDVAATCSTQCRRCATLVLHQP
jgi:hypothetical protein